MFLYTFIMEFDGGSYISQFAAENLKRACLEWANKINVNEIYNLGPAGKRVLIEEISKTKPVAVDGFKNIWCVSGLVRGKLALINIVQTDKENNEQPATDN